MWNNDKFEKEILKSMQVLCIDRMPSRSELESIKRTDLASALNRSYGYYGWAKRLGIKTKDSETKKGKKYEIIAETILKEKFPNVEIIQMSQNHPFDILLDGSVKIDVKVGTIHNGFDVPAYTFRTGKKYGSCDIYLCIGLNSELEIDKIFVIPTIFANVSNINICMGGKSKYLKFDNRWDYIRKMMEKNHEIESMNS